MNPKQVDGVNHQEVTNPTWNQHVAERKKEVMGGASHGPETEEFYR